MSQTAYGLQQTPQPGVLFDISEVQDPVTFVNQDGTWNIPFGVMVARQGSQQNQCKLPSSSTDEMLGLSMLAHVYDPSPNGTRSEEHTSELQSLAYLVCRLLLEKKKYTTFILNCVPNTKKTST